MKLIFLIVCLTIVLLTLETFIVSGFHTKGHRLLPLILGLFALYDFYLIVEYLTGNEYVFSVLKQLLFIQLLDVILYYIFDFTRMKVKMVDNIVILGVLIVLDILIFTQIQNPSLSHIFLFSVFVVAMIAVLMFSEKALKQSVVSRQTKVNNRIMFGALSIPAFALILWTTHTFPEKFVMPIAIDLTCLIFDYLFFTDRLRDVDSILKEEHFQTLDIPAFLFDQDLSFIDASQKARELFPEQVAAMTSSPNHFVGQDAIEDLIKHDGVEHQKIKGRYYRCAMQEAYYKGKMKGYILTYMDVTEQKTEAELAKEMARQKSDFLASMSHDLRSPLHAIIGSSEIVLSRTEMSERSRVMVNHIHEAGNNLLDIVNSILDFSKLESGNLQLYPKKYNFKNLIQEQAEIGFANLKGKPVKFSVEIMDAYPEYLYGDELRVRQIVQNLISNAVKFTEKGFIRCIFRVLIEDDEHVRIEYSVQDSGIGMTKEQTKIVFLDYVTYASDEKKEGTGLGLSIVRKLANMMGGTARAESDGKTGSTVFVRFYQSLVKADITETRKQGAVLENPILIESEMQLGQMNQWKNTQKPSYVYPNAKVLIADDMQVNCEIFKELTIPWGFSLDVAKNGLEAVEMVKNDTYDLIFLDQMMPIMSGTEAADEIRTITDTKMILLTANITESMRKESKEHGFVAFMQKPIELEQLKINLEAYLPENLRQKPSNENTSFSSADLTSGKGYYRALVTYVAEMKELYAQIPRYMKEDLVMFRNKVHGIKGASRQLGKENIALQAEIMEMAAITENMEFIRNHFETFYGDFEYMISACEREIKSLERMDLVEEGSVKKADKRAITQEEKRRLLEDLSDALEQYDMTQIEACLEGLGEVVLDASEQSEIGYISELYVDMEYEMAQEKVQDILMHM